MPRNHYPHVRSMPLQQTNLGGEKTDASLFSKVVMWVLATGGCWVFIRGLIAVIGDIF